MNILSETYDKRLNFALQIFASIATLAGIGIGTTTTIGAACYAVALVVWWWLTFRQSLWGLVPLNVGSTILTGWTLYHSCI